MSSGTRSSSRHARGLRRARRLRPRRGRAPPVRRARPTRERRQVLAAIGPFWDGNEVWLLAAGGALFVAFPRVLASGLSGFYFAIFLVLWMLDPARHRDRVPQPRRDPAVARRPGTSSSRRRARCCRCSSAPRSATSCAGVPLDDDGWFALRALHRLLARRAPRRHPRLVHRARRRLRAGGARRPRRRFLAWKTDGPVQERSRRRRARLASRSPCSGRL